MGDPFKRQLVLVRSCEGVHEAREGSMETLLWALRHKASYDHEGTEKAPKAYAIDRDGDLVPVSYTVEHEAIGSGDDYLGRTVTLTFPDGAKAVGHYMVDGRA